MSQINFHSPTHELLAKEFSFYSGKNLKIVDYGCGEGELLNYLPLEKIKQYQGYEVNVACIPVAKKKWSRKGNFHFDIIDRKRLPALGKEKEVDAIFLIGVIQYLPKKDLGHVLREANRVLKPGGKVFISCTTDHLLYTWLNVYRLFLPHFSVNRNSLLSALKKSGLKIEAAYERGLFLTPFFSNILVFFFDAFDKVFFRTRGELGPAGRKIRRLWAPIIKKEFQLPIDHGYTLFVVAST